MKRDKFYDIAEQMYVEQFITVNEIANRVSVNERTIRRWKAKGRWDEKRKNFYNEITASKESIYEFSRKMLLEIENDVDNKKYVDASRYYTFLNLVEELVRKPQAGVSKNDFARYIKENINIEDIIDDEIKNFLKSTI